MEIQLEFNLDNKTDEQMTFHLMQKQIDKIYVTTEKVRKRLFAELGDVKKKYADLKQENEDLKSLLRGLGYGKTQWIYGQDGYLFNAQKHQTIAG